MSKTEFIAELRAALAGELPENEIENNINYYESYIREQALSNSEEQVLELLGDPRLIAKTIIETYQLSHGPLYHSKLNYTAYQDGDTKEWSEGSEEAEYDENKGNYQTYRFNGLKWYHKILLGVIAILVLSVVLIVGGLLIRLFFYIGMPLLVIYFIYRAITNNRNR